MVRSSARPNRKETGKKYIDSRKKKKFELAGISAFTKIGKRSVRQTRVIGGNKKVKTLAETSVNIFDPKTKKCSIAAIKNVLENPANRHFVRRNILTKGTVIETDKGKAKVTSRPGQEGVINAVLM